MATRTPLNMPVGDVENDDDFIKKIKTCILKLTTNQWLLYLKKGADPTNSRLHFFVLEEKEIPLRRQYLAIQKQKIYRKK